MSTTDIKANIQKAYDNIALRYKEWTKSTHPTRIRYLDELLSRLQDSESAQKQDRTTRIRESQSLHVLELGCGAGIPVTKQLAAHTSPHLLITANDISAAQLELAKSELQEFNNVDLLQYDMMGLHFKPASFAAVIGMYSLIHLPKEEQEILVSRLYGWLNPGGLFLANFAAEKFDEQSSDTWLGATEGRMFWSSWGQEIVEILKKTGFEVCVRDEVRDTEEWKGETSEVKFIWILAMKAFSPC